MSGGSYNYLCFNTDDLTSRRADLDAMAERLTALGWAPEAAQATRQVIDMIEQTHAAAELLSDVWRAVEWWDSSDWAEDQVREEIAKHRAALPAQPSAHRSYRVRLETAATGELAERTLSALRMVRGVATVEPEAAAPGVYPVGRLAS